MCRSGGEEEVEEVRRWNFRSRLLVMGWGNLKSDEMSAVDRRASNGTEWLFDGLSSQELR